MTRQQRRLTERKLKKIKIIPCDIKLTASSGLGTVLEIFDNSPLAGEFRKCLPERVSHRSSGSYFLALMVMAGHIHGVDALSDLAEIQEDPYLMKLFCDDVAAVRTIGDFFVEPMRRHAGDQCHVVVHVRCAEQIGAAGLEHAVHLGQKCVGLSACD